MENYIELLRRYRHGGFKEKGDYDHPKPDMKSREAGIY